MTILLFLALLLFFGWPFALLVLIPILSYRRQMKQAIQSANYNAYLWSQSELARHIAETEEARLRGALDQSNQLYNQMSDVARQAIHAAESNQFPALNPFGSEGDENDAILNANEFD